MNRRGFIKSLIAGGAAIVAAGEVDLERILWVPGQKTIFLPPVKPLVHGFDAQQRYNYYRSQELDQIALAPHGLGREIRTAAGRVVVDARENVISLNGRKVGAQEAARLRLRMFNPSNPVRGNVYETTCQIIADRVAAGWPDPVGPGGMPEPPMMTHRIILEGA